MLPYQSNQVTANGLIGFNELPTVMGHHYDRPNMAAWWYYGIELFFVLLPLCVGNPPVTVAKGRYYWSFDIYFASTSCWKNTAVAGELSCIYIHTMSP